MNNLTLMQKIEEDIRKYSFIIKYVWIFICILVMISPFYLYHLFRIFQNKIKYTYINIDEPNTPDFEKNENEKREESAMELNKKTDIFKRKP
jgi:hypothetical protein